MIAKVLDDIVDGAAARPGDAGRNVAVAVALDFDAVSQHKAPVATLNADELAVVADQEEVVREESLLFIHFSYLPFSMDKVLIVPS